MSRAARDGVVVLLDGQGGDEIAAGYAEYLPSYLAELSGSSANGRRAPVASPLHDATLALKGVARRALARTAIARRGQANTFLSRAYVWEHGFDSSRLEREPATDLNSALALDLIDGKLENYLRYADRNSMAHSREVRLPFLSHLLVEFMFSLPSSFKIHDGWSKYVVRKALAGRVPERVLWRKEKVGFATPNARWLSSPAMQAHVREAHAYLVREGIVEKSWVRRGERDWEMVMAYFLLAESAGAFPRDTAPGLGRRASEAALIARESAVGT